MTKVSIQCYREPSIIHDTMYQFCDKTQTTDITQYMKQNSEQKHLTA